VSIAADLAIIFVPGIRPKPAAELAQEQLRRCLVAGVTQAGGALELAAQLAAAFQLVGWSRQFYGSDADITEDIPGIERLLAAQDSREVDAREAASLSHRVNAVLYDLADRFPWLAKLFGTRRMDTRVAEMHRYFSDQDGKATIARAMLADALRAAWDQNKRVVLIGHSFGAVIAYDTLWELSRLNPSRGSVDMFISMGSPLSMHYIRNRLKCAACPEEQRYPLNICRWVNFAAIGEATAQRRKIADCFHTMLDRGLLNSIDDDMGLINQFRGPEGLNVHKCYGYMANEAVGRALRDFAVQVAD
jgi:hypothetical protein